MAAWQGAEPPKSAADVAGIQRLVYGKQPAVCFPHMISILLYVPSTQRQSALLWLIDGSFAAAFVVVSLVVLFLLCTGLEELAALCYYCGKPCHASGWGAKRTEKGYCCAKFEKAPRNKDNVTLTQVRTDSLLYQ